jgi:hypothetical protein
MQRVLDRLDRLEKQNQELVLEIQALRSELGSTQSAPTQAAASSSAPTQSASTPAAETASTSEGSPPTPAERLDVQESRTDELAQSKVGTSQRMPVWLTGMVLFNTFSNGKYGGSEQYPATAALTKSAATTGASLRQTVIGLKFDGPDLPGGGKVSGSAYFDFWGAASSGYNSPGYDLFRVRTATIDLAWKNTTITAGQDKPIVAPRDPTSLAQVGVAPLSGAGNLWNWQPQVRIEQRFAFGGETGLRAQAGVYETAEVYPSTAPEALAATLGRERPAFESRLVFYHGSEKKRLEIAPGFHSSVSHVAGQSIVSQLGTLDWLFKPASPVEITGAMYFGSNDSGLGGLQQGFTILASGNVIPVHATGGWNQLALFPTSRISLHFFAGEEADRASDLVSNSVRTNLVYAGNIVYKLAPNVLTAIEVSQTRTDYIASGLRMNNHYDLALAYLF